MFQPRSGTTTALDSVAYRCVSVGSAYASPLPLASCLLLATAPLSNPCSHGVLCSPGRHPSPSSHIGLPVCLLRLPTVRALALSSLCSCLCPPRLSGVGACVPSPAALCCSLRGIPSSLPYPHLPRGLCQHGPQYFIRRLLPPPRFPPPPSSLEPWIPGTDFKYRS